MPSHTAQEILAAFEDGTPVWVLDTNDAGEDDVLIEPPEGYDDLEATVLAHFEVGELPARWSLRRVAIASDIPSSLAAKVGLQWDDEAGRHVPACDWAAKKISEQLDRLGAGGDDGLQVEMRDGDLWLFDTQEEGRVTDAEKLLSALAAEPDGAGFDDASQAAWHCGGVDIG